MIKNKRHLLVVDLPIDMHQELLAQAKERALTKGGYARMILKKALEDQDG